MQDKLEQYIRDNQAKFKQRKMPDGHQDRFTKKLDAIAKKKSFPFTDVLKIAASILIILGFGMGMFQLGQNSNPSVHVSDLPEKRTTMSSVNSELAEVEGYYQRKIQVKQESLSKEQDTEHLFASFNSQLQALEEEYALLERNLSLDPSNQHIIQSMIMNYKLRIEVLEKLNATLEKDNIKRLNTQKDEINA